MMRSSSSGTADPLLPLQRSLMAHHNALPPRQHRAAYREHKINNDTTLVSLQLRKKLVPSSRA